MCCVLLLLVAALCTSHTDLQRFLCRWFAWSSTLLLSLSFTQRAVVKSVPTPHLHDCNLQCNLTNQTWQQTSCLWCNTIAAIIDCQMILFSPFATPLICSRLNAATCKCDRIRVIECWEWVGGRVLIHYKLLLLYECYHPAGHTQANMHFHAPS